MPTEKRYTQNGSKRFFFFLHNLYHTECTTPDILGSYPKCVLSPAMSQGLMSIMRMMFSV